jgi:hypothetical protein
MDKSTSGETMKIIKNFFVLNFKRLILFSMVLVLFINFNNISGAVKPDDSGKWENLKYAIFFTYGDVVNLLADSTQFQKTMDYFAPIKASKVYLEGNSRGDIDIKMFKNIADRFRAMGIEADGCMVPVSPKGGPSTYNDPEDLAALKKRMEALAQVFDNIILDDWLFTTATDPQSVKDRGKESWADYRTKLILKQSKKYIIDAAKKVNPNAKVIIKYPDWYEGHRQNGYDVYNETNLYDKMAVGIETRNPEKQDQHIPIYSGYIFQKWFASVDTSKWIGSWLDNYGMKGEENQYVAQVWQAVFAQTPEIILWCAGQLYPTNPSSDVYPHFVDMLPEFDKVAGLLKGQSKGVPIYLPYGSTGEYNIFGYLGMAGIPLDPVAKFPTESDNAIFTLHSLFHNSTEQLAKEMIARLNNGHDIFMTWELWQKLDNTEFKNTLSLVDYGGTVTSSEFRTRQGWFREESVNADRSFTFPRIQTTTWPYVRGAAVVKEDFDYGILLETQYLKGTIYVLNMPDNSYDLLMLPKEVLNRIRESFSKELGFTLMAPGKVGMYLFGEKQYVLYNMSDDAAPVSLRFSKEIPTTGWQEILNNEEVSVTQDTSFVRFRGPVITDVSIKVQPYGVAIIQAP